MPVVVPTYNEGEGQRRLNRNRRKPSRTSWRQLQPYVVNLYKHEVSGFTKEGWCTEISDSLYAWEGIYDAVTHRGMVAGF